MTLKEKLIRKIAQEKNIPESVVSLVIDNQFKELMENMHTQGQFVLDLPGFCKFKWRHSSTERKLKSFQDNIASYENIMLSCDEKRKETIKKVIKDRKDSCDYIIGKVYGCQENRSEQNSRRVEEQSDSK